MPKFIINGDFLCRNLTGIERFAYEICVRLDKIIEKDPERQFDLHLDLKDI